MAKKPFALRMDELSLIALQQWADQEFRSLNGQIEYLLHDALRKAGRLPKPSSAVENEKPQD